MPPEMLKMLARRAGLLEQVRRFFRTRHFLEVTTPVLSPAIVVDQHIDPYEVTLYTDPARPDEGVRVYLRTSPEAYLKRLVAAGATSIFELGPVFRAGEQGPLHRPEFTMLEWYRVGDKLHDAIELLTALWRDLTSVPQHACQTMSYQDAFRSVLEVDPLNGSTRELEQLSARHGGPTDGTRDDHLNYLLGEQVVPRLSREVATFIHGFPASQAALAQLDPDDPSTAMRFELYFRGIELANGYQELQCGKELTERFASENAKRRVEGKPSLRGDTRLADAMGPSFPACSGVAVGFDRLVLVVSNQKKLDTVMPFAFTS